MKKQKSKPPLSSINFYWEPGFKIKYENYRSCQHGSDCCDNDYCRCGIIENAEVTEVGDITGCFETSNEFSKYCVDRLLVARKIWDSDKWEVRVQWGYYGQEIDGVYLKNAEAIENEVNKLLGLSDADKLKYVLNLEYGYILDVLENKAFEICEVDKSSIIFGQEGHYKKCDKDIVEKYRDYELPRGICVKDGTKYRVIDGYHRISACQDEKVKIIVVKDIK